MNKLKKIIKNFLLFFNLSIAYKHKISDLIPEISEIEKNIIETCIKYSMTTKVRMYVLVQAIKYVKNNNLDGIRGTLLDFFIQSNSKKIKAISVYNWISGFIYWNSLIYDIPIEVKLNILSKRIY